jgi:hypothetical protein
MRSLSESEVERVREVFMRSPLRGLGRRLMGFGICLGDLWRFMLRVFAVQIWRSFVGLFESLECFFRQKVTCFGITTSKERHVGNFKY